MSGDDLRLVAPLVVCGALPKEAAEECLRLWQSLSRDGQRVSLLAVMVKRGLMTRTQALVLGLPDLSTKPIFPNYRLLRHVGEGGMASVYEATYLPLQARVALKVLKTEYCLQEPYRLRFKREANILLHLRHENIVEGREYDTCDGVDCLAMGFVDGLSLLDLLDRGIRLSPGLALHVAAQVASALEHMREKGIVHRDIKPGNLVLDVDGTVRIIDFGLAKVMSGMWQDVGADTTVGTLEYMSPEQACGAANLDARSDLYSLGVTLFHMLTNSLPFTGSAEEIMYGHVKRELEFTPEQRSRIPPPAQFILRKAMAKDVSHRYDTPQAMADDLAALCGGLIAARGPVPDEVVRAVPQRAAAPAPAVAPRRPSSSSVRPHPDPSRRPPSGPRRR